MKPLNEKHSGTYITSVLLETLKDYNIEYYDDRWYFISPDNVRFKCDSHLNRDLMFKMCEILPLPTYKVVI